MRKGETGVMLSASDLAGHLACRRRTELDVEVAQGRLKAPPVYADPAMELLQQRGFEHEQAYVASLGAKAEYVTATDHADALAATLAAMKRGVPIIVQATLSTGRWFGRADILRRVDESSALGAWSYQVADTKLAAETKASTILQLCLYSEMLGEMQGTGPTHFHVVTPGTSKPFDEQAFRLADFAAYYRHVRARLDGAVPASASKPIGDTYPDPRPHCDICRWESSCDQRRRADDSLWLVAGITGSQQRELSEAGLPTLAKLGKAKPKDLPKPERGTPEGLARTHLQAKVQLAGRVQNRPIHELLPVEPGRGFCRLPAPSPGDVYFDIEGDRMGLTGGREFLFGLSYREGKKAELVYRAWWALSDAEERTAFEQLIDFVMARRKRHPDMHIYHYAPYEPSALKRLMGRYGTREEELDVLLRGECFVDLCSTTKQALRASVERYSIKDLEAFYGFERKGDLRTAGACVRAVQLALGYGQAASLDEATKAAVVAYNRDDCDSTAALQAWLETLRAAAIADGQDIPRPTIAEDAPPEKLSEKRAKALAVVSALTDGLPEEGRTTAQQARWLLAQMVEFHRREEKVFWWEDFRLRALDVDEAKEERAAIGGLVYEKTVGMGKVGNPTDRYRYPEQDLAFDVGDKLKAPDGSSLAEVVALDCTKRTVDLKKPAKRAGEHPPVAFCHELVHAGAKEESLLRFGQAMVAGSTKKGAFAAATALLEARAPRVDLSRRPGESQLAQCARIAPLLAGEVLPIQGPPGAGKTHTAARMIVALVAAGKKVGITATSHKVIRNLLRAVVEAAAEAKTKVTCVQKVSEISDAVGGIVEVTKNPQVDAALADGTAQVAAGTAWLWAREELQGSVDVLFVDEAGQMSLADALAVAPSARSMVLVGDPRQLEQPQQGTHPEGAATSALEHLLGEHATVPEGRGIFLAETWRMAPAINEFTSEQFYDGRLGCRPDLGKQVLIGTKGFDGAGLWYAPVAHTGNRSESIEEAAAIDDLVAALLKKGATWVDRKGKSHPLGPSDILVVAPYNTQVDLLTARLGPRGIAVGTVDKFQGQEAPIVIYSMATSHPEDAPRGMEFLYSRNRLNVATSRARCTCILVASPRLFEPECHTPRQMQLANAFCRYLELARVA